MFNYSVGVFVDSYYGPGKYQWAVDYCCNQVYPGTFISAGIQFFSTRVNANTEEDAIHLVSRFMVGPDYKVRTNSSFKVLGVKILSEPEGCLICGDTRSSEDWACPGCGST